MQIDNLPEAVQAHLLYLIRSSSLPDTPEFRSRLAGIWNKKCSLFEQQIHSLDMDLAERMDPEDSRAMIILTYSGSIRQYSSACRCPEICYSYID